MTTLLQRAVAEVEKLPPEDQDAIAARFLAEVEDERQWRARFAATSDERWDRLVAEVRRDVAVGGTHHSTRYFRPTGSRSELGDHSGVSRAARPAPGLGT